MERGNCALIGGRGVTRSNLGFCDYLTVPNLSADWRSMMPFLIDQLSFLAAAMQPRGRILVIGGHTPIALSETIDLYTLDPTSDGDWSPQGQWARVVCQAHVRC